MSSSEESDGISMHDLSEDWESSDEKSGEDMNFILPNGPSGDSRYDDPGSSMPLPKFMPQHESGIHLNEDMTLKSTFGYKSKELRHPLRKPEEEFDLPEVPSKNPDMEGQNNKTNFIMKNRQNAKRKEREKKKEHPAANTVTLTQEQLNTILASVGHLNSGKENSLRISIDPANNEIQIDKPHILDKAGGDDNVKPEDRTKQDKKPSVKDEPEVSVFSFVDGELVRENPVDENRQKISWTDGYGSSAEREKQVAGETEITSKTNDVSGGGTSSQPGHAKLPSTLTSPRRADGLPFVVSTHMTVAEKKRLQWAREKAEMEKERGYNPWGRPGAGAPIRADDGHVLSDYRTRKEEMLQVSQDEALPQQGMQDARQPPATEKVVREAVAPSRPPASQQKAPLQAPNPQTTSNKHLIIGAGDNNQPNAKEKERRHWVEELDKQREEKQLQRIREKQWLQGGQETRPSQEWPQEASTEAHQKTQRDRPFGQTRETPAAMRSSFVIGEVAPNERIFDNQKAQERKKWLADLELQMEEKRLKKLSEKQKDAEKVPDTWADRLSYPDTRPPPSGLPLPSAAPAAPLAPGLPSTVEPDDANRVSSAPLTVSQSLTAEDDRPFLRGQNIYIDPTTLQELGEKRRRHLEHQDALKAQIEEKQRLKSLEREKAQLEEMAEEQRLKAELDRIQQQDQQDQQKQRQKEEERQVQINQLKSKMDEAQEAASQERMLRRLQMLREGGHDVTQLQAQYDAPEPSSRLTAHSTHIPLELAMSPRAKVLIPSQVPGLILRDLANPPNVHQSQTHSQTPAVASQDSLDHQPYVENRILTPSRYRNPSLPRTDPISPKREFGTQTLDGDFGKQKLLRPRSGVEIEYHPQPGDQEEGMRAGRHAVKAKGTRNFHITQQPRAKSEPSGKQSREKAKEDAKVKRPQVWNYSNQRHKKPIKQSERDPHYEQRKREREQRRAQRELQLLALVEANKHTIPGEKSLGSHGHSSMERQGVAASRTSGHREVEERTQNMAASRVASYHDHVPHVLSPTIQELTEPELILRPEQQSASPVASFHYHQQASSPPLPSIRHRGNVPYDAGDSHVNTHRSGPPVSNTGHSRLTHYDDLDPMTVPDGDFVPFMRTSEVLDPARASEPLQVSRENTRVLNARHAYLGSRNPANYGQTISVYQDSLDQLSKSKDPILNPDTVKIHPTARQDAILAQLFTLKQNLMQRQRELETCMTPTMLDQQ